MAHIASLPENATLLDVFKAWPTMSRALLELHEPIMRGASAFTPGEREYIAAYVSSLNACPYCYGVHSAAAAAFDITDAQLQAIADGRVEAAAEDRMKPVLAYAAKVTTASFAVTTADADAIIAAGWPESAVMEVAAVAALYNFMNRFVNGLGLAGTDELFANAGPRLRDKGYVGTADMLGI